MATRCLRLGSTPSGASCSRLRECQAEPHPAAFQLRRELQVSRRPFRLTISMSSPLPVLPWRNRISGYGFFRRSDSFGDVEEIADRHASPITRTFLCRGSPVRVLR